MKYVVVLFLLAAHGAQAQEKTTCDAKVEKQIANFLTFYKLSSSEAKI